MRLLNQQQGKTKVLFISPEPPEKFCGVRVVVYRHLIERNPFELVVVTNADYFVESTPHEKLRLPYLPYRLRRSRFGPRCAKWITDYENLVWPYHPHKKLNEAVEKFKPDVILTLAHNGLSEIARRFARRCGLPLAGLFLDWFPIMDGHYGHKWTRNLLSRRFRRFYQHCDLAICTSEGMQAILGPHPNCHVVYPMPGQHKPPDAVAARSKGRFRLVYVGSVERFYGRMLCSLFTAVQDHPDLELIIVGPNADWPKAMLEKAQGCGTYLGFKLPEEAASVLASADALLVLMSFEPEYRLFTETSFTTKFLDYCAFRKPVILWGPEYCTPARVVQRHGGAALVPDQQPQAVISECSRLRKDPGRRARLSAEAEALHTELFNPERLQSVFVREIEKLPWKCKRS